MWQPWIITPLVTSLTMQCEPAVFFFVHGWMWERPYGKRFNELSVSQVSWCLVQVLFVFSYSSSLWVVMLAQVSYPERRTPIYFFCKSFQTFFLLSEQLIPDTSTRMSFFLRRCYGSFRVFDEITACPTTVYLLLPLIPVYILFLGRSSPL